MSSRFNRSSSRQVSSANVFMSGVVTIWRRLRIGGSVAQATKVGRGPAWKYARARSAFRQDRCGSDNSSGNGIAAQAAVRPRSSSV